MSNSLLQSQIDAAQAYDSLFVPALFGQWTKRVVDASQLLTGQKALDVACGTGVLAQEMASRVGVQGSIVAVDPNPGMLSVARDNAPGINWQESAAENLPFPDQAFDAVLSQFGLMFFQNRAKSIGEMLRVLKHPGRLAVAVWDAIENIPGYAAELALIERLAGSAAAEAVRAPFVLGDRDFLRTLFLEAGAVSVEVTTLRGIARFPSIRTMVEAELRGWLPVMGVELSTELVDNILPEAESALAAYKTADGTILFTHTSWKMRR